MIGARRILEVLEAAGEPAYMVGGAVRDYLLGMTPHDIDIVTRARPDAVISIMEAAGLRCTNMIGKAFGVIGVTTPEGYYEVATFRSERYGADAHRPEEVHFGESLAEDVQRRDFTVNGLAMDACGTIYDYVGGQRDLKKKILRTIGEPSARFCEDALRLFRACRFVGQLGFEGDSAWQRAMSSAFSRVPGLSLERVRGEIDKLLLTPYVAKGMDILVQSGLGNQSCQVQVAGQARSVAILPELWHLVNLPQNPDFHAYDAWHHTLVALQESKAEPVVRWGALLHDVGKGLAGVRSVKEDGRLCDYGHEVVGAEVAESILLRLGYGKVMAQRVRWIVAQHSRFHAYANHEPADVFRWVRQEARSGYYRSAADLVEACRELTEVCVADVIACGRAYSSTDGTRAFGECLQDVAGTMPIHTRDLQYAPTLVEFAGKHTGEVLRALLRRVQDGQLANDADTLQEAAERYMARRYGGDMKRTGDSVNDN